MALSHIFRSSVWSNAHNNLNRMRYWQASNSSAFDKKSPNNIRVDNETSFLFSVDSSADMVQCGLVAIVETLFIKGLKKEGSGVQLLWKLRCKAAGSSVVVIGSISMCGSVCVCVHVFV